MTPPLNKEPRRIRPPFDVVGPFDSWPMKPGETSDQWRARVYADVRAALLEALDGVELGAYDHRVIDWLAHSDIGTVGTITSLIYRARELGGAP